MEPPIYREGEFAIRRYGRHFALYQGGELVCVCVYKKGAASVLARLARAVSPEQALIAPATRRTQ